MQQKIEDMIVGYIGATTDAVSALFQKELYGHSLVVIYSAIDAFGLLDAPPAQGDSTGATFQAWVKNYMLGSSDIEFNEVDLWAARCGVLHTFTAQSKLWRNGHAHQLVYYSGDKESPKIKHLIAFTKTLNGGSHLAVHYGDLCEAFFGGMRKFYPILDANCARAPAYADRLRNVLQVFPFPDPAGTATQPA